MKLSNWFATSVFSHRPEENFRTKTRLCTGDRLNKTSHCTVSNFYFFYDSNVRFSMNKMWTAGLRKSVSHFILGSFGTLVRLSCQMWYLRPQVPHWCDTPPYYYAAHNESSYSIWLTMSTLHLQTRLCVVLNLSTLTSSRQPRSPRSRCCLSSVPRCMLCANRTWTS